MNNHVIIIILQGHLSLEITNIMFEALSGLHFDCEEVIAVLLKLPSGGVLVIKGSLHLFETPEWASGESRTSHRVVPVRLDGNTQLKRWSS